MRTASTKRFWIIVLAGLVTGLTNLYARAQTDTIGRALPANMQRREHPEYDEEIQHFGKRDRFFTVRIVRKNGQTFRTDSYTMLPKVLANGIQLDSTNRVVHHGPTKIMYPDGTVHVSCDYKDGLLNGPFMVFDNEGLLKRREYYKRGRLTQSECYGPGGEKEKCEPYYQPAKFLGDPKELENYLKQKVATVLDGVRIWRIVATLTINEIGQIVRLNTKYDAQPGAEYQFQAINSYLQQTVQNMPDWLPGKLSWKPATNDGEATISQCVISFSRPYPSGPIYYRMGFGI